jgi:putative transposase
MVFPVISFSVEMDMTECTKTGHPNCRTDQANCHLIGLVFHSDIGSQYTSKRFRSLLKRLNCRSSMGDVGACWDNAVVERFFGSLKHDWLFKVAQPTREHMTQDVTAYMKYYNLERLHSSNGDQSPIEYENSFRNVSSWT